MDTPLQPNTPDPPGGAGRRVHPEPPDPVRGPFELDRHRIIESTAFRRLEGKTQVFAPSHHDHFRTRMTHTLEAAQLARTLAGALGANAELAEAISLAHDLGHPPFGHAGEAALDEAMADHDGFDHNAHSLRVVEYLEHPFPPFRGLNLTRETLAGLRAHCTRYDRPSPGGEGATVEADVASVADRIAYNCHDLEDAIGAGFFGLSELHAVSLWRAACEPVAREWPDRSIHAVRRVVLDNMLHALLADVVRTSSGTSVRLSESIEAMLVELEEFLVASVYRRAEIAEMDRCGRAMILSLFGAYRREPALLPTRFAARIDEQGTERVICDYIAGMTDRFLQAEHQRLCTP